MQVIADTSFLMIPGMFGVDILAELERLLGCRCELLVPSSVVRELEKILERGKPKEKAAAKMGLLLARGASVIEVDGEADESVLKLANEKRCPVGTTDKALRMELRRNGISVIFLRQKSYLVANGLSRLKS